MKDLLSQISVTSAAHAIRRKQIDYLAHPAYGEDVKGCMEADEHRCPTYRHRIRNAKVQLSNMHARQIEGNED
jgi:ActR/RegA family two-component response regulator